MYIEQRSLIELFRFLSQDYSSSIFHQCDTSQSFFFGVKPTFLSRLFLFGTYKIRPHSVDLPELLVTFNLYHCTAAAQCSGLECDDQMTLLAFA